MPQPEETKILEDLIAQAKADNDVAITVVVNMRGYEIPVHYFHGYKWGEDSVTVMYGPFDRSQTFEAVINLDLDLDDWLAPVDSRSIEFVADDEPGGIFIGMPMFDWGHSFLADAACPRGEAL